MAYIIVFVFWEDGKPFLEEDDELIRHLVQLVEITVGVDIAEAGANGVVHKHDVGELVPRTIVVFQRLVVLEPVGADFHQGAIHRAAPGTTIQPDDRPLFVRDVLVLEMPKEEVAVMCGCDFDMAVRLYYDHVSSGSVCALFCQGIATTRRRLTQHAS